MNYRLCRLLYLPAILIWFCNSTSATPLTGNELAISLGFESPPPVTDTFVVGPGLESDQWEQVLVTTPPDFEIDVDGSRINIRVVNANGFQLPAGLFDFPTSPIPQPLSFLHRRMRTTCP